MEIAILFDYNGTCFYFNYYSKRYFENLLQRFDYSVFSRSSINFFYYGNRSTLMASKYRLQDMNSFYISKK